MHKLRIGLAQMDSRDNIAANLAQAEQLIARAAKRKATFVALPENALYIGPDPSVRFTLRAPEIQQLIRCARQSRIWLLIGSIPEAIPRSRHHYNTSLLYGPDGTLVARYRKIHPFRCRMPNGQWLREAATRAGSKATLAKTSFGNIGLTICYDLRMPELFGRLAKRGAHIMTVPSNFTAFTGKAHWHTLLRARAIENQAFVIAPAQCGTKFHTRSYGHALIINPWGKVVSEINGSQPGMAVTTIDLDAVARYRTQLPALHDRMRRLSCYA